MMRYSHYWRRTRRMNVPLTPERLPFNNSDKACHCLSDGTLTEVEALKAVNNWNRLSGSGIQYWIDEGCVK